MSLWEAASSKLSRSTEKCKKCVSLLQQLLAHNLYNVSALFIYCFSIIHKPVNLMWLQVKFSSQFCVSDKMQPSEILALVSRSTNGKQNYCSYLHHNISCHSKVSMFFLVKYCHVWVILTFAYLRFRFVRVRYTTRGVSVPVFLHTEYKFFSLGTQWSTYWIRT